MRILSILCGVAILFTTLAFAHLLQHHYIHASQQDLHSPVFLAAMALAVVLGILSFTGAVILLRRSR